MLFRSKPITTLEIKADSYKVSPSLLNLITREQFGGSVVEDASRHLHDFVEICEMQKFKSVESDVLKLKLFPFSLRGKAKEWLHFFLNNITVGKTPTAFPLPKKPANYNIYIGVGGIGTPKKIKLKVHYIRQDKSMHRGLSPMNQ